LAREEGKDTTLDRVGSDARREPGPAAASPRMTFARLAILSCLLLLAIDLIAPHSKDSPQSTETRG